MCTQRTIKTEQIDFIPTTMKFRIRFFCNFLQSSDVISIRLDDQENFLVSDLSDVVYKDYEIEFRSTNVGKSHLHFFTLVRPICIEASC